MDKEIIYLDNNATTRPIDAVVEEFARLSLGHGYYNTNTNSSIAREIREKIELCSSDILEIAGLSSKEFGVAYATSSTEINKAIIRFFSWKYVIMAPYEHKSIVGCFAEQQKRNLTLSLDKENGIVTPEELDRVLKEAPRHETVLVSIMAANNEFPSRNDLPALYEVVSRYPGTVFHTDATQLFGKVAPGNWHADLINFSTHKFHGLKGVGVLIYRKELFPEGPEGLGLIGGTPNSPAILAHAPLWNALKRTLEGTPGSTSGSVSKSTLDEHYLDLRIHLLSKLHPLGAVSFEPKDSRFLNPGTCLLSFPGKCNLLIKSHLDKKGIIVSIGSACDTEKKGASNTIRALGLLGNDGIIRVSFGSFTTVDDLDAFVEAMEEVLPFAEK